MIANQIVDGGLQGRDHEASSQASGQNSPWNQSVSRKQLLFITLLFPKSAHQLPFLETATQ